MRLRIIHIISTLEWNDIKIIRTSRLAGLITIFIIYLFAAVMGIITFYCIHNKNLLLNILFSDLAATLFVWAMGVILNNSSVYDPYWSVAPVVIIPLLDCYLKMWNSGVLLMSGLILIWGIRLTVHWMFTFKDLKTQDWRYTQLKKSNPRAWFVTNLFGIHLFPTFIVYLVTVPAYLFFLHFTAMNIGIIAGACLCVFAITLQAVSDRQMMRFRKQRVNLGHVNRTGLWKYMRHPNYLGEILMWWGIYAMLLFSCPRFWLSMAGAIANTLMFVFISIPLMERRQLQTKPEYAEYITRTGMILPKLKIWIRRSQPDQRNRSEIVSYYIL